MSLAVLAVSFLFFGQQTAKGTIDGAVVDAVLRCHPLTQSRRALNPTRESILGLTVNSQRLYIVHMKFITASEARKNWFRLLDDVAGGEVVTIRRNNKRIVLSLEKRRKPVLPNYRGLIAGKDLDNADKWGWDWTPGKGLVHRTRK